MRILFFLWTSSLLSGIWCFATHVQSMSRQKAVPQPSQTVASTETAEVSGKSSDGTWTAVAKKGWKSTSSCLSRRLHSSNKSPRRAQSLKSSAILCLKPKESCNKNNSSPSRNNNRQKISSSRNNKTSNNIKSTSSRWKINKNSNRNKNTNNLKINNNNNSKNSKGRWIPTWRLM